MVNHPNRSRPLREINAELLAALKAIAHEIEARAMCVNMRPDDPLAVAYRNARAVVAHAEGRL